MKTFKHTVPEPSDIPSGVKKAGIYANASVCFLLLFPYLGLCLTNVGAWGGFYLLGMLWLFIVSPVLVLLQLAVAFNSFRSGRKNWKFHIKPLAVVVISYFMLFTGVANDCALSA